MAEHSDIKFTDFDYWSSDPHLQMLKAALPFMQVSQQRTFSILVRFQELFHTMDLYGLAEDPAMEICALDRTSASPMDMLMAVKPFAPSKEQDFIDVMINFIQGFQIRRGYHEMQGASGEGSDESSGFSGFPLDQLKNFLSPQQQTQLENIQMVMQALQML